MTARVSEVIRGWLGWCPDTHVQIRVQARKPNDVTDNSSGSRSFQSDTIYWAILFRNQTLLLTIGSFLTGLVMFVWLGNGWSNLNLFILGIIAGLPVSMIVGIWYWQIFTEVLHEGPVALWRRYDKTSATIAVVTLAAVTVIPILVITGALPGVSLEMTNAVFGGFMAVIFWGQLISICIWESDTGLQLHYDLLMLELVKEEKHAAY
jgi:hypothetical protein